MKQYKTAEELLEFIVDYLGDCATETQDDLLYGFSSLRDEIKLFLEENK